MDPLMTATYNLEENFVEIKDKKLGIVTDSVSYMYVKEVYPNVSVLKLSMPFPFPDKKYKSSFFE